MSVPEETMSAAALDDLRRRVLSPDANYTPEELHRAVRVLVGERIASAQAVATASRKRPSRSVNLDDLLDEPPKTVDLTDLT